VLPDGEAVLFFCVVFYFKTTVLSIVPTNRATLLPGFPLGMFMLLKRAELLNLLMDVD
jgi:hypothetical protein